MAVPAIPKTSQRGFIVTVPETRKEFDKLEPESQTKCLSLRDEEISELCCILKCPRPELEPQDPRGERWSAAKTLTVYHLTSICKAVRESTTVIATEKQIKDFRMDHCETAENSRAVLLHAIRGFAENAGATATRRRFRHNRVQSCQNGAFLHRKS